jgi:hypothetical protein
LGVAAVRLTAVFAVRPVGAVAVRLVRTAPELGTAGDTPQRSCADRRDELPSMYRHRYTVELILEIAFDPA